MINECKNCGGNVIFSPKDKGNVCENCGSVFSVKYDNNVVKKDFAEAKKLNDIASSKMVNVKCDSCGASMVLLKNEIKAVCPYCDSSTINEVGEQKMMDIDGIVPFEFNKDDALVVFQHKVSGSFFANKKIFKGLKKDDIKGVYINAFIFDINTNIDYKGTFNFEVDAPGFRSDAIPFVKDGVEQKKLELLPGHIREMSETMLYQIGKSMLEAYGCFEE